jgi:hypothetical protein
MKKKKRKEKQVVATNEEGEIMKKNEKGKMKLLHTFLFN